MGERSTGAPMTDRIGLKGHLASLFAGAVIGLSAVITGIGVAVLAFPGPLQAHLFMGVGAVLTGAVVMLVVMAVLSSFDGAISLPQEAPAAILGLLGVTLWHTLDPALSETTRVAAVLAAMALCTASTGAAFYLLGRFRLGDLIRFIPYPVVGGVLAGLGWLMVQGGFSVLTGHFVTLETLPGLLTVDALARVTAGALVAAGLFLALSRVRHYLTLPVTLAVSVLAFYLLTVTLGSIEAAVTGGWLLGPLPEQAARPGTLLASMGQIDWWGLASEVPKIATLILVSSISVLLYASGLELELRRDMDLNRELKASGISNALAGLAGGLPGFHSISDSLLAREMGALGRATPIWAALFIAGCLAFGLSALGWLPRAVLGGLLFFLGAGLLWSWVVRGFSSLTRSDWLIVLAILITSAAVGYLEAIGFGIIAGIVVFAVSYSRVDAAKHVVSGATLSSNRDRGEVERSVLAQDGEAIQVLVLQGYLFFGTAHTVLQQVRSRIDTVAAAGTEVRFLLLDFAHVSGLDSSTQLAFRKLVQLAESRGMTLVFTGLDAVARDMLANHLLADAGPVLHLEPDLDHGMEWCESRLLVDKLPGVGLTEQQRSGLALLLETPAFEDYVETLDAEAGARVITQGAEAHDLFLVRSGEVTVRLEGWSAERRLRTYGPGTVVGEIAMYLGTTRSASVFADVPTRLLRIDRRALDRLTTEAPALAAAFHEALARTVCERLAHSNRLLDQLT